MASCAFLSTQIPAALNTSPPPWVPLLKIASILATKIFGLKGFVMYSSTPSSKPRSSSRSSDRAVNIMIGTLEYLRIVLHTSQPSILGIITSKSTRLISFSLKNTSIASSPSPASRTRYPLIVKKSLTSFLILSSSSTINTFIPSIFLSSKI